MQRVMKRRGGGHGEGHENLERWLLTYADMITLLTAFFLMLYSMSVMSKGKFVAVAQSVRSGFGGATQGGNGAMPGSNGLNPEAAARASYTAAVDDLRRYVKQSDLGEKVKVREDERGIVISLMSDKLLFVRGSAELGPKSDSLLVRVAKIFKTIPNQIQIEGHTCNIPIHTSRFPSNWELSTARAGSVLRYFTENLQFPHKRFLAAGYADTRPLAPNTAEANRIRNRRVDIVLLKTDVQQQGDLLRRTELDRITVKNGEKQDSNPPKKSIPSKTTTEKPENTGVNTEKTASKTPEDRVSPTERGEGTGDSGSTDTILAP